MARPRLRLTGFARLLIALLFIVPIAFVGASFFNNENPLDLLKEWAGYETTTATPREEAPVNERPPAAMTPPPMEKAGEKEETVHQLREQLNEMYDKNTTLERRVRELEEKLEAARTERIPIEQ